jgi:hypothetical protein
MYRLVRQIQEQWLVGPSVVVFAYPRNGFPDKNVSRVVASFIYNFGAALIAV